MTWLGRILAGPSLWAVNFVLVYGLHGAVCADVSGPEGLGSAARLGLIGLWSLGLLAFWPLLRILPQGAGLQMHLPRAGAWIGLVATGFTLFPVALTTSC